MNVADWAASARCRRTPFRTICAGHCRPGGTSRWPAGGLDDRGSLRATSVDWLVTDPPLDTVCTSDCVLPGCSACPRGTCADAVSSAAVRSDARTSDRDRAAPACAECVAAATSDQTAWTRHSHHHRRRRRRRHRRRAHGRVHSSRQTPTQRRRRPSSRPHDVSTAVLSDCASLFCCALSHPTPTSVASRSLSTVYQQATAYSVEFAKKNTKQRQRESAKQKRTNLNIKNAPTKKYLFTEGSKPGTWTAKPRLAYLYKRVSYVKLRRLMSTKLTRCVMARRLLCFFFEEKKNISE